MKPRSKHLLRKIVLFILVAASGAAVLAVAYFFQQVGAAKQQFAEFTRTHPASVGIAAYTFDENGTPLADGQSLYHNADTPMVLASTMKVAVLAVYAQAVAQGELDPNQSLPVSEWEQYYLPGTDGGAHTHGLALVGLKAGPDGLAQDPAAQVRLQDLARLMIHTSGNAETDYLIARLGRARIDAWLQQAGIADHSPMHATLGVALALTNHENTPFRREPVQALIEQVAQGDLSGLDRLEDLYLNDPAWRAAQIEFMRSGAYTANLSQLTWEDQVAFSQLFPKASARSYARLMAQIASGRLPSPEASQVMQAVLESAPSDWPLRVLYFDRFGAKDGVTGGVLSLASYAVPKAGPVRGRSRVVVVLANELPYELWAGQVALNGHYLYQTDLARAQGVFQDLPPATAAH